MKYLGKITDNKDLVTKEYVDGSIPDVSDKQDVIEVEGILEGDGEGNISAAETQEVTTINVDSSPTANSSNLVTSGGVYTALQNASGGGGDIASTTSVLKGDGNGGAVAATAGTDYQAPLVAGTDYAEPSDIPTKVSDLQNDSGFISSYTETDPTVPSWAKASTKPTYTASEVGAAESSHSHGNITNGGDITATAPTVASGDQIIINDHSASKITNGPTFDGSTTSKYLSQKGTWESVPTISYPVTSVNSKTGAVVLSNTDVGAAATSHTHGNIQNGGTLQTSDITIANGDKLVVTDSSDSSKVARASISFDGSTTSKYLSQKGTWESLPTDNDHRDSGYGQIKAGTASSSTSAITANTTTAQASTYNELLTINPGNKWVSVAANNSSTSGSDTFTIGHSAGLTAKTSYGSTATTASADGGTITITDVKYDEAGHITASTDRTITLSQSTTPASHASTDTTYGVGNASNYGHVKLSDSTSSTNGTSNGIAATPAAVKAAYDKANNAVPKTVSSNPGTSTISHTWSGFSISITTDIDGNNSFAVNSDSTEIHNVVTPTANGDAVPKSYVDNAINSISIPTVPTMDASPTDGNNNNTVSSNGVYDMVMGRTKIYTGSCPTAAATAAKVVTLDDATGFSLTTGTKVAVTFSNANTTTGTTTLNVNGTGAKNVVFYSDDEAGGYYTAGAIYNQWGTKETLIFTYTGTSWCHTPSQYFTDLTYNLAAGRQTKITASGILKGDGAGTVSAAVAGTDYASANHASTATTYGVGDSSNYGHVKLSDSTSSTSSTTGGIAATPAAVKAAYDLANEKQANITVSGILKGNGSGIISAAVAGTDYQTPLVAGTDYATPSSVPSASTTTPSMDGTASYGSGTDYARSNHVHPTDTSRAPLASPTFTGTPAAPTAAAGTNTTQIATTAFVGTALNNKITYGTEDLTAGTSALGTGVIYLVYE